MLKKCLKMIGLLCIALMVLSSGAEARKKKNWYGKLVKKWEKGKVKFTGSKKCNGSCHDEWQNSWRKTVHFNSYQRLLPDNGSNPECLWCHTTGYGKKGGFKPAKDGGANYLKDEPNKAAVGCEMCHSVKGGSLFRKVMRKTKGKFHINKLEKVGYRFDYPNVCKRCHDHPKNPHKKKFDFKAAMKNRDKFIHKKVKLEFGNLHKNNESKTAKNSIPVEDWDIQGGKIVFK